MIAEPIKQGAETLSAFRLASAAIESWAAQVQAAEWRAVTHTMRAVSAQLHLTFRTLRGPIDHFARLAFNQGALHAPGHGLRFFQADADQVVRLAAFEGGDLQAVDPFAAS